MLTSLFLMAMVQGAGAPVVINEFSYDDSGLDDREFVELYNASSATIDISGWKVDSADSLGPNTAYTIKAGVKLAAGAFYVLGSAKVANVTQVVGTTNLWENSAESLTLRDKAGKVVDTLVYEANKLSPTATWTKGLIEGDGVWGNFASIDLRETSWSRLTDGMDSGDNRDFHLMPSTPGKSNNLKKVALLFDNFDKGIVDTAHVDFIGTFDSAYYIDPTVTGGYNKNVITASPQGGKALIMWDRAGGGNTFILLRRPLKDIVVEAWVYFDAAPEPVAGQFETWSIGAQGTTGTFSNHPDPSRRKGFRANGNTGVAAVFQNTDKDAFLYLVDHGNGGTDFKVLGKIQLFNKTVGTNKKNDGWQRLRLEVSGDYASLRFGGSYGQGNGVALGGRISQPRVGGIYFGYREYVTNNLGARPITIDRLTIRPSSLPATNFGTSTATTKGTPQIGMNTLPMLGTSSFAMTGSGLVPSGASIYILGATKLNASISPPFPAGSKLYTAPLMVLPAANSATGTSALPLPIPTNAGLVGTTLVWQIFDVDAALKVAMPLGSSGGLQMRLGL